MRGFKDWTRRPEGKGHPACGQVGFLPEAPSEIPALGEALEAEPVVAQRLEWNLKRPGEQIGGATFVLHAGAW